MGGVYCNSSTVAGEYGEVGDLTARATISSARDQQRTQRTDWQRREEMEEDEKDVGDGDDDDEDLGRIWGCCWWLLVQYSTVQCSTVVVWNLTGTYSREAGQGGEGGNNENKRGCCR
jgi:hypothetical protein